MMTAADLIRIESRIVELWKAGEVPYMTHLAGGNEQQLIDIFSQIDTERDYIFVSHRAHYHALLFGMPEEELIRQILAGRSMCLCWPRMVQSSIVAGTCSIAAGKAYGIKLRGGKEKVWCFLGDGASDEGSFTEAARWADANELPIRYIIEWNDSSCGVLHAKRWGGSPSGDWPDNVQSYRYTPVYPHAGCDIRPSLKPERIEEARRRD